MILAGLATPLVLSVHSVVSFDFAIGLVPGWHSTISAPFFVAGAVFSGFAMVMTLMLPARKYLNLKSVITQRHVHAMAKIILVTSWIVTFSYAMEHFMAFYSGNRTEIDSLIFKATGPYAGIYWTMLACNCAIPQLLWAKWFRDNTIVLWIICVLINVGMWTERFMIIAGGLTHDFVTSIFRTYHPTLIDISLYIGTLGLFSFLFLLALRIIPIVPVFEVKELNHETAHTKESHGV